MQSLRIAYAGTPEFAVPALESVLGSQHELVAVLTQPDRQAGRGRKISESAVKKMANSANVRVFQPEKINSDEFLSDLVELKLDLIIVAAYGQIFSERLLSLPRFGCINIHASLLPRWRGAAPIQHAILAGDESSGVTIMQMHKAMDAGDIWLQSECMIVQDDTSQTLHDRLAGLAAAALLDVLDLIVIPNSYPTPQDPSQATYCPKLKKRDGLINWSETANVIVRKIRAYYPWPGAYTTFDGRRLRITKAQETSMTLENSQAGKIIEVTKNGIVVTAGEHSVVLNEFVPEGGKLVSAADFSNSNQVINQVLG